MKSCNDGMNLGITLFMCIFIILGDTISSNGENKENIDDRRRKTIAATTTFNSVASNDIFNRIETVVLLELHEKVSILLM